MNVLSSIAATSYQSASLAFKIFARLYVSPSSVTFFKSIVKFVTTFETPSNSPLTIMSLEFIASITGICGAVISTETVNTFAVLNTSAKPDGFKTANTL